MKAIGWGVGKLRGVLLKLPEGDQLHLVGHEPTFPRTKIIAPRQGNDKGLGKAIDDAAGIVYEFCCRTELPIPPT